jgi:hypothetical protein
VSSTLGGELPGRVGGVAMLGEAVAQEGEGADAGDKTDDEDGPAEN